MFNHGFHRTDFSFAKFGERRRRAKRRSASPQQARRNRVASLALSTLEQLEARNLLAADVIISEIMYHPSSALIPREQIKQEYIEIYNKGDAAADLNGWQFTAGVDFTFPSVSLPAGAYLVIAADLTTFNVKYPAVTNVIGGWYNPALEAQGGDGDLKQIELADDGEKITLRNAAGTTINSVVYASQGSDWAGRVPGPADTSGSGGVHYGWEWYSPADGNGKSMELMNPAVSNAFGQNWSASTAADGGTPGAVNSVNTANIAPIITDFQQTPALPKTTDSVVITARITDESTLGLTATLNYRTNTGVYTPVTMFDDGAHGDGYAGDGVFGGTIPAQSVNLTVVEFYVRVTDTAANAREYPKPGLATQAAITSPARAAGYALPRAVYQVNNAYPDPLAWTPTSPPQGYMVLKASEKAELDSIFTTSSLFGPNSRMAGTYISVDGTGVHIDYEVGIRNRGRSSRSGPPNNFEISFAGEGWNDQSNLALDKVAIPSQIVGSVIFNLAGVESYQAQELNTFYNGVNQGGQSQRVIKESIDDNFVSNHWPNDDGGNLYSAVRDEPGHDNSGGSADFHYINNSPDTYRLAGYVKRTNLTQDDYGDIFNLIKKINNIDANGVAQPASVGYLASVSSVIDVEEWLRYLAINMLVSNKDSGLYTGVGHKYEFYRGLIDTRFKLVPHDLDSIMGLGGGAGATASEDPFGPYTNMPAFSKFLTAPEIAPLYYKTIVDVITTTFNNAVLDPVIDRALEGVNDANAASMKTWVANRGNSVLGLIKTALTATSALTLTDGYPKTTAATAVISGFANAITTRSVLVNGVVANFVPRGASWSINGVALKPGINRILVQSMDGFGGTGNETARTFIDIWRDDGSEISVAGPLASGTTNWTADAGPYRVTADVTVPADGTLVIEPGTSIYFDAGARLIVNGTLTAVGTDLRHIRFTRTPGNVVNWGGIQFNNSLSGDNKLIFVELEFGDSTGTSITATDSKLTLDRVNWLQTTKQVLNLTNASFSLTNSTTPINIAAEVVHIEGVPTTGMALIQGNTFGQTNGKFDVIGVTGGQRPNTILQILDNTFNGSGDDTIDLKGADAHIEKNVFMNVATSALPDTNNAISAGASGGVPSEVTSVRNYFYSVAHVYLAKEGSFIVSTNNTAVNVPTGVVNFDEPGVAASPGLGATIDGDIYLTAPTLFQNLNAGGTNTQLTVSRSATPGASAYPGVGNTNADPRLTKTASVTNPRVDFVLKPGSPAIGTGPNGANMGAIVPAGATISGEPPVQTAQNSATLVVGGAGIVSYKYRLNGGVWNAETPVATPINLAGLANGSYTVQVAGRNSAGVWQADAAATSSTTWTVNSALVRLMINEVLANSISALDNAGTFPGAIELYNAGANLVSLAGMSITNNAALPTKYIFPAGTSLGAGQYMTLYADSAGGAPGFHLGFALSSFGEGVYLYNTAASGAALIDSVVFGQQAANLSIGRIGQDQLWGLTTPTIGSANIAARLGNPATLKINEWLASEEIRLTDDFVELHNPDTLPVALGGLYLSDEPVGRPTKHQIAPLSFIAGSGYTYFIADNDPTAGPEHLNFALSSTIQYLGLYNTNLARIDYPIYFMQTTDYAQGLSPDGSATTYAYYKLPTPGLANSNSTNAPGLSVIENLRITEIMYNPLGSTNTEYIELHNNGVATLDLAGVRLTGGIDFTFPAINLAAGEYVLVVADQAAFQARYGSGLNVAGQYTGDLSNSSEGLLLQLPVPFDSGALRFDYSDQWYPTTDGDGYALAIKTATAAAITWGDRASWQASSSVGGSPGAADPATTAGLTGFAFRDLNNNGLQDGAEPALSGVGVALYSSGVDGQIGGGDDVLVRTGNSDNLGGYSFFALPAGSYYIQYSAPLGYGFTIANQGGDDALDSDVDPATGRTGLFALAASQYETSLDVGLVPALANATVVGRRIFYNNSSFDGNTPGAGVADDAAIASDKSALTNGSTATFANYTNYSRGINGIIVDIAGLSGTPVASDFVFRVGNSSAPGSWPLAPAPQSIAVRPGAGTGGSARVELIWADGAITNQWLQVTVKAGGNTGLAVDDVFYFGNAVGETGNSAANAIVNSTDEVGTRNNSRTFSNPASATFVYDFNRDGLVNATDQIIARMHSTTAGTALQLINVPLELSAAAAPIVMAAAAGAVAQPIRSAPAGFVIFSKAADSAANRAMSWRAGDDYGSAADDEPACLPEGRSTGAAVAATLDALFGTHHRPEADLEDGDLLDLIAASVAPIPKASRV